MAKNTPNSSGPDDEALADAFARRLAEVEHNGQVATALARATAEVGSSRTWDLGAVARSAMREATHLAEFEREMATRCPPASGRLRLLGDIAVLCLAEVIRVAGREMAGYPEEAGR